MQRLKAPRRNCKTAEVWKNYYQDMAAWYKETADVLSKYYPESAEKARVEGEHFREGANQIVNKTHPSIVAGNWK